MNSKVYHNIRNPVVAGSFYPGSASQLESKISSFVPKKSSTKIHSIGCVLPHAGYVYSGAVACATVSSIIIPENIILLGPNHTGLGQPFSVMTEGIWRTPLGDIEINTKLAKEILGCSRLLEDSPVAHSQEHSLEVELPILQYYKENFKIVPIALYSQSLGELKRLGSDIAEAINKLQLNDSVLLVASSDMTHYEPQESAEKKDKIAIEAILELDEDGLFEAVGRFDISMCGYMPVAAMLSAAKKLGANSGTLVKYQTSAEASHDNSSVVGYAGIIITQK